MFDIESKISKLNKLGIPAIFIVCGNNSTGKTVIARKLIQNVNFYQSINLGLASKMIRFFRPDFDISELENFNGNRASDIFKKLVIFIIESYAKSGVNVIIEGVQIGTKELLKNNNVLGGVILTVNSTTLIKRGVRPETHFNRVIRKDHLKKVHCLENSKFKIVKNEGTIEETFGQVVSHLNKLLTKKLKNCE